jgi:methionyl-tRNA synthetase
MTQRFYITTPIYYPNGEPHLGHTYTTVCADVIARYHRLNGHDTFFLTGTDEHGVKMVKTAAAKGIQPRQLADEMVAIFENWWKETRITHDDFIRTSSDRHCVSVQEIVRRLHANGDIYLGAYEGWYDEGQEEFVTETEAKERNYLAFNKKPLVRYKEPTYFFRLSKYVPQVLEHIEQHPDFIRPDSRRNEVLSKLKMGVDDLSISRATLKWGVPLPHDPGHVLYVWIDALSNYITALGYGTNNSGRFELLWPVDIHLIGKEILWFHAVYWPAMLMGLGVPLPKQVYAHGWWTSEGQKMSKTVGNFIDLAALRREITKYGFDTLRYYMLRAAPFGADLDWKETELASAHNELSNVVGNCLNRILNMAGRYLGGTVPEAPATLDGGDAPYAAFLSRNETFERDLKEKYRAMALQDCGMLPVELARLTNGFIEARAPFKLVNDPAKAQELRAVMWRSILAIQRVLVGLLPVMPEKAAEGLAQMGIDVAGKTFAQLCEPLPAGHRLGAGTPLFPKTV